MLSRMEGNATMSEVADNGMHASPFIRPVQLNQRSGIEHSARLGPLPSA